MLPSDLIITNLEKQTGKKFKKCKFNIDGWIFDDFARYQVDENNEIIKIKITDAGLKKIPEVIFDIESLKELSIEENKL